MAERDLAQTHQDTASETDRPGQVFVPEDFVLADLDAPAIWDRILTIATREGASDIHLTCQRDGLHIALRLDGQLVEQGVLPADHGRHLINHLKILATIDLAEARRPQDGHIISTVDEREVDIRIGLLPSNHGQDAALRLLDRDTSLLGVKELGLLEAQAPDLETLLSSPTGLILVTGSTGAGKTTTLYALLREIANGKRKVVTIENPIEYDLAGINQSEVNPKIGLDHATLLRSVLRQDPNVIMIGEIRDAETADVLVRAANSGRLVLATSYAVHVASALESLISLGANPHFVARAFRGALAQTLVRRLCPKCSEKLDETRDAALFKDVADYLPEDGTPSLAMGRGCPHCRNSGYRGRLGIFEVLVADEDVRDQIAKRVRARELYEFMRSRGMLSIAEAGKIAAAQGKTTLEELFAHVSELWTGEGGADMQARQQPDQDQ
jgi:type II secretory ATPase GspE/PulE/Tfp pilus assembly ATPase PilB-like protein